ncbi:glutathione S-transferase family protein [Hyphococcus sp.]|uniref:glutathione S-transferase family protein n=1 Tax=Hyphococcus sp. TaxID=2038636 RepID=UPI003D14843C
MKLYSFGPGANSLKPLLALYEKELEFESVFLNPAKFEHHADWYKKLNPNGQVPALEHKGKIITESTVICEYLEDEFPDQNPLRPADNFERAQMRIWTKWVDEYFCWCVSTIGWHRMVGNMVKHLSDEEFEEMVAKVPIHEQKVKWRRAREGFPKEMLDEEMRKIGHSVKKLEARLTTSKWLACGQYTLADICNFAIANRMDQGFPEFVNEKDTPAILDWLGRINERPAAKKMFANQPSEFNRK